MGGVAWTEEEDNLLRKCVEQYGEGKWHRIPILAGLSRCRKSCRLRWLNYLRPNINRGRFTEEEKELIIKLHKLLGNRWSLIAGRLPGRTANDVKNFWNCHLCKKLNVSADQTSKATEEESQASSSCQHNLAGARSSLQLANEHMITSYNKKSPPPDPKVHASNSTSKQVVKVVPLQCSTTSTQDEPKFNHEMMKAAKLDDDTKILYGAAAGDVGVRAAIMDELPVDFGWENINLMADEQSHWDLDDLMVDMDLWSN